METTLKKQILSCNDLDLLRKLNSLIYKKIQILSQIKALDFEMGDSVKFHATKEGKTIFGTITAIKKKNIKLLSKQGVRWTVAISLVDKVIEREKT